MRLFEALAGPAVIARERGLAVVEGDALTADALSDGADIVVVIGNPPYRRRTKSATLAVDDFCTGSAGVHRKNLHNEYVYFWRWALRVGFEVRRGPAVVCFVTAGSYLRGPAFGGMRGALRRALDELWLIDLEGDQRAARASANVFPIRTPVAIALGVRYGDGCEAVPASVHYTRIEGAATHKLSLLGRLEKSSDLTWQPVPSGWQGPLHAVSCSEYWRWPALTDLFPWQLSGVQFKRTWPIGSTPEVLRGRWRRLLTLPDGERRAAFGATRDRDVDSSPPDLLDAETRLAPLAGLAPDARHVRAGALCLPRLRPPLGLARCTPWRLHATTFVACGGPATRCF